MEEPNQADRAVDAEGARAAESNGHCGPRFALVPWALAGDHLLAGRYRDNTLVALDLHCRIQCGSAAANTLEKLPSAGTLHDKRLKQFRIVRFASASFRLSFTRDR